MTAQVPRSHLLDDLAWTEVRATIEANMTVVLPLGAIEQHGPNLPIDTDAYLARRLALGGAQGRPVVVAPAVGYGARSRPQSGGGERFPGTLSLSGGTFMAVVGDVLSSLLGHGYRRLLVYSWHMENRGFAYEAAFQVSERFPDATIVVMEEPFDSLSQGAMATLFEDGFPGWPLEHAGVLETSLLLHLRPASVLDGAPAGDRLQARPYDILPEPAPAAGASGVLWHAEGASAAKGELAYGEIVAKLGAVLDREFGGPA